MQIIELNGKKLYKYAMGASSFLVDIENGAKLLSWDISIAGAKRDIIYCEANSQYSGNPILFPFAGTCSIKGEPFKWKTPQGDILDMPQHGFAKDAKFEIVSIDDNGFSARLINKPEFAKYYPYSYNFYVNYSFSQFAFRVELKLENTDSVDIAWACGNHFYFNVPWHENCSRNDYLCDIQAKSAFLYKDMKLEKVESLKSFSLGDNTQINVLHTNLRSPKASLISKNGEEEISINFNSPLDKNNCIVTWSKDGVPYYCVEPWQGLANAPEHKKGLHILKAGESETFSVEVFL